MRYVENTHEFRRVRDLPRRAPHLPADIAAALTAALKTPNGTMVLRAKQSLALHDIGVYRGAFIPMDVGDGKTIVSLLAPYVLDAQRPLLLGPAALLKKTGKERAKLAEHWRIPNNIRLVSYQILGQADHADLLEKYQPDVLILDESHKTKNQDAALVRRINRYVMSHPDVVVVVMTGTIMRTSLHDYAHQLVWALKDQAPIPLDPYELSQWAACLDDDTANTDIFSKPQPGALLELCSEEDWADGATPITAARRAFCRRLVETPGVVASAPEGTQVDVGLTIRAITYDMSATTESHFKRLREEGITPDGYDVDGGGEEWQTARELALGMYMAWVPRPPEPWMQARRAWFGFARTIVQESATLDSPDHVAQACEAGRLPRAKWDAWRSIRGTFTPNPVPHWHDDAALLVAAKWMREQLGLVFVKHVPFARRLAEITGAKYYGAKGLTDLGENIEDAPAGVAAIASVDANKEGRNIQTIWHRALVVCPEDGWDGWHQLIGRFHRPQQTHDVVIDVMLGCAEHVNAWRKSMAGALAARDTVGSRPKLLLARLEFPSDWEMDSLSGPRWEK